MISIHPPRAGWDRGDDANRDSLHDFNPPTPCGVGPLHTPPCLPSPKFQSTHPVRGGTTAAASCIRHRLISIHPPRAGWDGEWSGRCWGFDKFQSTHPVRGGTQTHDVDLDKYLFQSTHPVRGGTQIIVARILLILFQSTHPVRGGTEAEATIAECIKISIHPPRAGWDRRYDVSC